MSTLPETVTSLPFRVNDKEARFGAAMVGAVTETPESAGTLADGGALTLGTWISFFDFFEHSVAECPQCKRDQQQP